MFRHCLRIVAFIVCCVVPLNATAVPVEVVTLEEEPSRSTAKSDTGDEAPKKKKKKRRKKKRPVAASSDEEAAVSVEVTDNTEDEPPPPKKKKRRKKKTASTEGADVADESNDEEEKAKKKEEEAKDEPPEPIDCFPALTEVETRRTIPLSCTIPKPVTAMELRYRPPGEQWKTASMKKVGDEWQAEIPCSATVKVGELEFTINARTKKDKTAGKLDPVTVKLVESTSEPPPAIPGTEAPARCFDPAECPGDMLGTAACPGTKKGKGVRSWGASCAESTECTKGLACVAGTCESPPKCEADNECESGVCSGGVCAFPDPEELASQLGPPKYNWFGLELGVDFKPVGEAVGVCGSETDDADDYSCFEGGDEYDGLPNQNNAGKVDSSLGIATLRAMVSYHRAFGRLLGGVRLGFAFRGAPEGFLPLHIEARAAYSLRSDPLKRRIRPYLGLGFGLAQVDTQSDVTIVDCTTPTCAAQPQINQTDIQSGVAQVKNLTAYRSGNKFFFGPTLSVIWAITNESGVVFNTNVMFPELVISPSVGYVLGL